MRRRRFRTVLGVALLLAGAAQLGERGYLALKGQWAAVLVDRAWARTQRSGAPQAPWPWADLHPVGELRVGKERRIVLSGATGESLAFGVGHVHGTAAVGTPGHCVLAGHRDGAFAFLRDLRPGDEVRLRASSGPWRSFAVREAAVVGESAIEAIAPTADDRLTLLTCYPFDTHDDRGLRWVVRCEPTPMGVARNSVSSSR